MSMRKGVSPVDVLARAMAASASSRASKARSIADSAFWRAPKSTDDSTKGYAVGHYWVDEKRREIYSCADATANKATWVKLRTSPILPLDAVPMAAGGAAYSTKLLRSAYAGPCINVVNTVTLATLDVGFVFSSRHRAFILDVDALNRFSNGAPLKVATFYDQSGNANHATQTTDANRPVIRQNFIDEVQAITFGPLGSVLNNNGTWLNLPAGVTMNRNAMSMFGVWRVLAGSPTGTICAVGASGTNAALILNGSGTSYAMWDGSVRASLIVPTADPVVAGFVQTTGVKQTFYHNNQTATLNNAGAFTSATLTGGSIGTLPGFTTFQGGFDLQSLLIYPSTLSDANVAALKLALFWQANSAPQTDLNIVYEGTSIDAGTGQLTGANDPFQERFLIPVPFSSANMGKPGGLLSQNISEYPAKAGSLFRAGATNILVLGGATNSVGGGNLPATDIYTQTASYVALARATGYAVILCTILPATFITGANEAERQAFNNMLRSNWQALGAVELADIAAAPLISAAGAMSNTAISPDGTHFTEYGYGLIAAVKAAAINRYLQLN